MTEKIKIYYNDLDALRAFYDFDPADPESVRLVNSLNRAFDDLQNHLVSKHGNDVIRLMNAKRSIGLFDDAIDDLLRAYVMGDIDADKFSYESKEVSVELEFVQEHAEFVRIMASLGKVIPDCKPNNIIQFPVNPDGKS